MWARKNVIGKVGRSRLLCPARSQDDFIVAATIRY